LLSADLSSVTVLGLYIDPDELEQINDSNESLVLFFDSLDILGEQHISSLAVHSRYPREH